MPRALPVALRQAVTERHLAGPSLASVAEELALSPWTVRPVWRGYRDRGEAGMVPAYAARGRPGPRLPGAVYATTLTLHREHPGWGAGLIRTQLATRCPTQPLPHERTLRRWFRAAGLGSPVRPPRPPDPSRSHTPHDRWQFDATVGRISLANRAVGVGRRWAGQEVTVRLTIPDDAPVWVIHDAQRRLLRQHPAPERGGERIRTREVSHRRPGRRVPAKPRVPHGGEPYSR